MSYMCFFSLKAILCTSISFHQMTKSRSAYCSSRCCTYSATMLLRIEFGTNDCESNFVCFREVRRVEDSFFNTVAGKLPRVTANEGDADGIGDGHC